MEFNRNSADIDKEDLYSLIRIQNEVVHEGLNISSIMFLVSERALEITGSDGAVIELMENDEMVYRATAGIANPQLGLRLKIMKSMSGHCINTGQILYCADSETDSRVDRDACRRAGLRSMIVTPLIYNEESIGVLKVLSKNVDKYGSAEIEILRILSELLSAVMYTAEKYGRDELFIKATTDGMTGIRNRSMFYDLLRTRIGKADRLKEKFSIISLDMDNLKTLNDNFGHKVGDAGIIELVSRINRIIRDSDVFCRLGGDEFGIIAENVNNSNEARAFIKRLEDNVNGMFSFEGNEYSLSVSAGCSVYKEDDTRLKELLDIADARMYLEKKARKSDPKN